MSAVPSCCQWILLQQQVGSFLCSSGSAMPCLSVCFFPRCFVCLITLQVPLLLGFSSSLSSQSDITHASSCGCGHAALMHLAFHKLLFHMVFIFSCGDGKVVSACAITFGQAFLMEDRVKLAPARGFGTLCSLCFVISIITTGAI